ncbi:CoB--CoM heterodisulfide reductase iron-sulfur subunit B family protein [Maridesulfovibrio ferrireducens]|uniref:CoB--CoM heterodisulfide reductase iron-sulfur subunit B family protein n=1 Tax=Maridesulfovibrio ferrireducens TaxID=246191 RepID=UPI001A29D626|nr:CoB--CoM heterodisulfide reductase iron-sulfur subunit B family protein [Maridesulfovibrio ferrireducens]MBI9109649.1 CoB--CoM heterodisulfide reductase iron-sulfur subunit B family protein [Maridesulfovibrio ferrireducens]
MSDSLTYAYYPGCSGTGTSIEYDMSTRAVCAELGITLTEIPDWSCCGSTPAHTVDHTLSSALSARNLALVEKMNLDTAITPCPSCLTNLKTATHRMKKDGFRDKVNKLLDTPYQGGVATKSVLQIIVEDMGLKALKDKAVKPLKGLKVAAYYGCIMNRPPEVMNFDDPEHPMAMDNIMTALGATVLPFPLKVECCGASFGIPRKDIVMSLSGKLLDAAKDIGAEALVTACPLCQMNLDLRQDQVNSAAGTNHHIPVFYYTQLIGLALGLSEKELGIDKLCVDPRKVINAIGRDETS